MLPRRDPERARPQLLRLPQRAIRQDQIADRPTPASHSLGSHPGTPADIGAAEEGHVHIPLEEAALMMQVTGTPTVGVRKAEFYAVVPFAMKGARLKVLAKTAPSGGPCTIQVVKCSNINDVSPTWSDVTGFTASIADGDFLAVADPTDVDLAEGDVLDFDVDAVNGAANIGVGVIGWQTS